MNTLQDPYTAMVDGIKRYFPARPDFHHTLEKIRDQPPTVLDMSLILIILSYFVPTQGDENLLRPLIGRVANYITTPAELKFTKVLNPLLYLVENSTDEIKPPHIETLCNLIDGTDGIITEEQEGLFKTLMIILALENDKAHATHLVALGIYNKLLPFMEKTDDSHYFRVISPIPTLILSNSSQRIRQIAYQSDLVKSLNKNPKNGIKIAALLSHYREELSPENVARFLSLSNEQYFDYHQDAFASQLIVQCNLSDSFKQEDFNQKAPYFNNYIHRLAMEALFKEDSGNKMLRVFNKACTREFLALLPFFRKLVSRKENVKHLFNIDTVVGLIDSKRSFKFPAKERMLMIGILHAFSQLPEEEIEIGSFLAICREQLFPIYKHFYDSYHAFQVAIRVNKILLQRPIIQLIGCYTALAQEQTGQTQKD